MTCAETQRYIASFINFEQRPASRDLREFKLERMRYLLNLLGDPQNDLKIIHVAGSKGKGSTCALTAGVLRAAGYKAGLYTSPHLNHYRERIRVLAREGVCHPAQEDIFPDMIREEELAGELEAMQPHIRRLQEEKKWGELSFFELFTALALCYFRQENVDWVVLETGMGGRLDATNAAPSRICAITPISLEHTQYLGDTIAKIAGEKAAIIKDAHQKVVIAPQEPAGRDVLKKRCAQFGIRPVWIGEDIRYSILPLTAGGDPVPRTCLRQTIRVEGTKQRYDDLELSLAGSHQAVNAATVLGIVDALAEIGCPISIKAVETGLRHAFWPGRMEVVNGYPPRCSARADKNPLIILDCAHNQASARNLVESIKQISPGKTVTLVVGVSGDKDRAGICRELNPVVGKIIATKADHPRAHTFSQEELDILFPGKPCLFLPDVAQAIDSACAESISQDVILVTGSVFVVSEARRYLCHNSPI